MRLALGPLGMAPTRGHSYCCGFGSLLLRVRAFLHKTFRVYHIYCNVILGYMCRIIVTFGTLKDWSLLINIFASNNCLSCRNIFQNGFDALSKLDDAFWQKAENLYIIRIIRNCLNFANLWHKHLLWNYKWNFRLPMSAFATVLRNTVFTQIFAFRLFHFSLLLLIVEVKNTICNSLLTITTSWQSLQKFGWAELHKIGIFLTKKAVYYVNYFWYIASTILKEGL